MTIYLSYIMEFNKQNIQSKLAAETHVMDEGLRAYMLKVYNYMSSGVFLTGIVSLILFKMSVVVAAVRLCERARLDLLLRQRR